MILYIHGKKRKKVVIQFSIQASDFSYRTASAVKIQRVQTPEVPATPSEAQPPMSFTTDLAGPSNPFGGVGPLGLPLGIGIEIDMNSGSEDEAADRALNGVARKLDKSLSVEYTVNELISEAMDVGNLAMLYVGEWI